jgi:hypothetical protein
MKTKIVMLQLKTRIVKTEDCHYDHRLRYLNSMKKEKVLEVQHHNHIRYQSYRFFIPLLLSTRSSPDRVSISSSPFLSWAKRHLANARTHWRTQLSTPITPTTAPHDTRLYVDDHSTRLAGSPGRQVAVRRPADPFRSHRAQEWSNQKIPRSRK